MTTPPIKLCPECYSVNLLGVRYCRDCRRPFYFERQKSPAAAKIAPPRRDRQGAEGVVAKTPKDA